MFADGTQDKQRSVLNFRPLSSLFSRNAVPSHRKMQHHQGSRLADDSRSWVSIVAASQSAYAVLDGVTMLPTFMPVATQAAIKGLTANQMEALGVTLVLNNTYHLNLRPGLEVLHQAGGAHKFQGWNRNLLTVSVQSNFKCAFGHK
jgi:hypothetical protein